MPNSGELKTFHIKDGVNVVPSGSEIEIHRLDPAEEWFRIKQLVDHETNWTELLAQYEPRMLTSDELSVLSYLSGKDYAQCSLFEISDFDSDESPFPYCIVKVGNQEYNFEEMGAGEGALWLIWWKLNQITRPAVLLLEEPEAHITCRSQRAVMNVIAAACEKLISCIVTTHSADIIAHVPLECVRLLIRNENDVKVIGLPQRDQLRVVLGVESPILAVALVEDRCARIITKEILRLLRPDIASRVQVADAGDNGTVLSVVNGFPVNKTGPRIIAVLDGDQRNEGSDIHQRCFFLPSNLPPELFLRSRCNTSISAIASALGIDDDSVAAVLSSIEGMNHHDWLEELARALDVGFDRMIGILFSIAVSDPDVKYECERLAWQIAAVVTGEDGEVAVA